MDASSAASDPGWRCQMSGWRCEAKAWNACPASCRSVITSSTSPTAFMKMNGRPRKWSVSQYPPGALPFRLSRSRRRSSIMVWNWPPSTGSTRSKTRARRAHELIHRLERPERSRAVRVNRQVPGAERVEAEPLASMLHDPRDGRRGRALDRLVEALAVGRGIVEPELGREDVVAEVGEARVPRRALAQLEHPVEQARQGAALLDVRLRGRPEGALPDRPVRALEERLQLRQRALHAVPLTVIEPVMR